MVDLKRCIVVSIVLAFVMSAAAGSFGSSAKTSEPAPLNMFRIGMLQPFGNLNPFSMMEAPDFIVCNLVYDMFINVDQDWKPVPNLAASWKILSWTAADNLTTPEDEGANRLWQYTIRDDVYWHDGIKMTVEDVNCTLNLFLSPDPVIWAFQPLLGINYFSHAEINKTLPNTVDLFLKVPSTLIDTLTIPIVPKHIFGTMNVSQILLLKMPEDSQPIGTGPFKFEKYDKENGYVTLTANDNYHRGRSHIDILQMIQYGNEQVMAEALKKGDIDIARFPNANTFNSLKNQSNITTAMARCGLISDIGFNCDTGGNAASSVNPLLQDEKVRQAIHYATNKKFIVDTILGGYADEGMSLTVPATPQWFYYPGDDRFAFDLNKANATLAAAGYVWNEAHTVRLAGSGNAYAPEGTSLEFELAVINTEPQYVATAPYLKAWYAIIGVQVTIAYLDEATMETRVYWNCDHEMYIWYWGASGADVGYMLEVQTSSEIWGWSDNFWSNETYDNLYGEQLMQTGAQRNATIQEMLEIHYKSSPFIIVAYPWFLLAWRTDTWTGYGDIWSHPGRSYHNYYTEQAMLMEIEPVEIEPNEGPTSSILIIGIIIVAAVVVIVAYAINRERKKLKKE